MLTEPLPPTTGPARTAVAVVDDHPVTREGVAALVSGLPGFTVTSTGAGPEALGTQPPDIVIHDLYLGDGEPAVASVERLSTAGVKVVVVSASRRPDDVLAAVRAGARGYVTKDADTAVLQATLVTVASGGFALSPQLADIIVAGLAAPRPVGDRLRLLSDRERQTLELIASGYTHSQTATRLGVSKSTVDTYVERIRTKLHLGNKADLVRFALGRDG